MAYYFTPEKGSKYAPCEDDCNHIDCAALRQQIESPCRICKQPIGYGARVYFEKTGAVHAACLEREEAAASE